MTRSPAPKKRFLIFSLTRCSNTVFLQRMSERNFPFPKTEFKKKWGENEDISVKDLSSYGFIGELSLDGRLRGCRSILPMVISDWKSLSGAQRRPFSGWTCRIFPPHSGCPAPAGGRQKSVNLQSQRYAYVSIQFYVHRRNESLSLRVLSVFQVPLHRLWDHQISWKSREHARPDIRFQDRTGLSVHGVTGFLWYSRLPRVGRWSLQIMRISITGRWRFLRGIGRWENAKIVIK